MPTISELSVDDVAAKLNEGGKVFLDVRNPEEYQAIHAQGTRLIPLPDLNPGSISDLSLNKSDDIYIICRSGKRSMVACEIFANEGYEHLTNVAGGTIAWESAGLPVNR